MSRFLQLFRAKKHPIIGMIHVAALPGTPNYQGSVEKLVAKAVCEAELYKSLKIDGVMVENMHDVPYVKSNKFTPETTAVLTRVCTEVRKIIPKFIPCGIQVLAGGNKEAIAIAQATDFQFIRCEGFVFGHVADEGLFDACAGDLLRYRRSINAENILILTDIKKKHCSHAITNDINIVETAKAAEFFLTDGLIITGQATGDPANVAELKQLRQKVKVPIIIGSGITKDNFRDYAKADAFIVGSEFKMDGKWFNDICPKRVKTFIDELDTVRNN